MMVQYLIIEGNGVLIHVTEMNLKIIVPSGRSEMKKQKDIYRLILYIKFRKHKAYL